MQDMLEILLFLIPIGIFYWLIEWELAYYKHRNAQIRYRSLRDPLRRAMYLRMLLVAVGAVLAAFPFIVLFLFRPL